MLPFAPGRHFRYEITIPVSFVIFFQTVAVLVGYWIFLLNFATGLNLITIHSDDEKIYLDNSDGNSTYCM